jgi:hypothetical protein
MQEEIALTKAWTDRALIEICVKAMNEIRPGERVELFIRCKSIRSKAHERISEALKQEAIAEDHPDGSLTIRVSNTFAVAVPENGKWKVQGFYLLVNSSGLHAVHVETKPITIIGTIEGPLVKTPEQELIHILGLFSLI